MGVNLADILLGRAKPPKLQGKVRSNDLKGEEKQERIAKHDRSNSLRYYHRHREEILPKKREYYRTKYANDPEFRERALKRVRDYKRAKRAELRAARTVSAAKNP